MRIRITFSKGENIRFTSHLDLLKAWERTFRRANLPLEYSLGFNPHPKISIASPLPLGYTSDAEILDAWLEVSKSIEELCSKLSRKLPLGISINDLFEVGLNEPSLQSRLASAEYEIIILLPVPDIRNRLSDLIKMEHIMIQKKGKASDIRPLIENINLVDLANQSGVRFTAKFKASQGETGRPVDLITALEIDPISVQIKRTHLFFN